jgi:hypothetical protein
MREREHGVPRTRVVSGQTLTGCILEGCRFGNKGLFPAIPIAALVGFCRESMDTWTANFTPKSSLRALLTILVSNCLFGAQEEQILHDILV